MKLSSSSEVLQAITVVGGLASTVALYQWQPWLAFAAFLVLTAWVATVRYQNRNRAMRIINDGASELKSRLQDESFHPDVIVAFTRTSAVFAGILAVRLKVAELLAIPRQSFKDPTTWARVLAPGDGIALDGSTYDGRKVLVVSYIVETGGSLENGLKFLLEKGVPREAIQMVSLYCTPAAKTRFPDLIVVHETSEDVLAQLPWVDGTYPRL